MESLTKEELLELIKAYSDYVMEYYEEHDEGQYPVCVKEFYDYEYQIMKGEE